MVSFFFFTYYAFRKITLLSQLIFATAIDVVAEYRKVQFHEIFYADDLVFMSDSIELFITEFYNSSDLAQSVRVPNSLVSTLGMLCCCVLQKNT